MILKQQYMIQQKWLSLELRVHHKIPNKYISVDKGVYMY